MSYRVVRWKLQPRLFPMLKAHLPPPTPLEQQLEEALLPPWVREYQFAWPARLWAFDYAWPDFKIALEVEGGTWSGGRHVQGQGYENDCRKYNAAAIDGWLLIRVTTTMVRRGEVVRQLRAAFRARGLE